MTEIHPFGNFVPKNAKYLILGSFPGKPDESYDWFYSNKRNQFWLILGKVYKQKLDTKEKKQKLFRRLKIAITDIIFSCERKKNSNLDTNLVNITYNVNAIQKILETQKIERIFFTSRFVEKLFKKAFPDYLNLFPTTYQYLLPSPSPRYARMSLTDKVIEYKKLLPSY